VRVAGYDVHHEPPTEQLRRLVRLDNVTLTPRKAGGFNDAFFNSPAGYRGISSPRETL
jgi:hypothetical protein